MGVVDYGVLNYGPSQGAAPHTAGHYVSYDNSQFAPYSNGQFAPPASQWMEPYLNLVASQHNATVSHHSPHYSVLEIEPSVNALTEEDVDLAGAGTYSGAPMERGPDRLGAREESSTTMGAVTLLAFLNLLGYIQTVLTGTGRRKRRSTEGALQGIAGPAGSLASLPGPTSPDEGRAIPLPPIPTFFEEVVRGLDFWQEEEREKTRLLASSRVDGPSRRVGQKEGWGGFLSSLGQRFRLAANLLGFLSNPGPSRVRRSLDGAVQRAVRSKRFTTNMNTWYDDLAGVNYDGARHSEGGSQMNGLLSKLMLGLGRGIFGVRA